LKIILQKKLPERFECYEELAKNITPLVKEKRLRNEVEKVWSYIFRTF